ncbi:hypothetical protein [Nocardioides sp. GY 10127]|uniref:hypothetical protein n=1 Tax=Nocardioides sp. GY 10127 TaxID=2569762 RepID=UPI0010A874B1|nr:hypothetical protein [Nocardioides sp. GY 10127]TIC81865.1 hypothetical protein E8D37_11885 [Nocardioides sp. GY 10127]
MDTTSDRSPDATTPAADRPRRAGRLRRAVVAGVLVTGLGLGAAACSSTDTSSSTSSSSGTTSSSVAVGSGSGSTSQASSQGS